jgi:hypothetical protein
MIGRLFYVVGAHEGTCSDCRAKKLPCLEFRRRNASLDARRAVAFSLCEACALLLVAQSVDMLSLFARDRERENATLVACAAAADACGGAGRSWH